jgi:phosphate transport system ATP-binding protein
VTDPSEPGGQQPRPAGPDPAGAFGFPGSLDGHGTPPAADNGSADNARTGGQTAGDTRSADPGPADTGPADPGPADNGPADNGPADNGHAGGPAAGAPAAAVHPAPAVAAAAAPMLLAAPVSSQTSLIDYVGPSAPHLGSGPLIGLEARNVSAWFGKHKVLERVSLNMQPARVTALIGPSGCGKSTFLRILNRMHEMVTGASLAGEVMLAGEDIYDGRTRPSEVRRRIGMVFQKPNPFPAMSLYDNVASGLKLAGIKVSGKQRDHIVETSLRRAGLWGEVQRRLRTPGGALSGGQQQRLCIARSLAVSPDVLLMDEPCSALDPTSTRRIEETIAELQNQVTIVIVTHNMQQAQRVSQDCAFFLATHDTPGYIVESGPTQQMFEAPSDPRTADYVHGRFG